MSWEEKFDKHYQQSNPSRGEFWYGAGSAKDWIKENVLADLYKIIGEQELKIMELKKAIRQPDR